MKKCEFTFTCDKQWEALAASELDQARYCNDCQQHVFKVRTQPQFSVAVMLRRCVAIADDNDFIGLIGEPRGANLDWMEHHQTISITLSTRLDMARLVHLRQFFPVLFDQADNEAKLLSGAAVQLASPAQEEQDIFRAECAKLAPELQIAILYD